MMNEKNSRQRITPVLGSLNKQAGCDLRHQWKGLMLGAETLLPVKQKGKVKYVESTDGGRLVGLVMAKWGNF